MNYAVIVLIVWSAVGLGYSIAKDGKPREGKHSFWTQVVGTIILHGILWWGGWYG